MNCRPSFGALLVGVLFGAALWMSPATSMAQASTELRFNPVVDGSVAGGATLLWILGETAGRSWFAPTACRWCEPPGFDASARSLRWSNQEAAQVSGSLTASVGAPVSAFGLTWLAAAVDGRGREEIENAVLIAEAVGITMMLNNIVKWSVARARPAVHFQQGNWESFAESERNLSFFSAHSSFSFSLAVASGTIASMRGYRLAPLVWAVGLPMAAFTAYSRVAGDAHYLSDVLIGSAFGAAMGFLIPYLFHRPTDSTVESATMMPLVTGSTVGVSGSF